ncbi:MAG: sigma-70 family RNA polymerase sigma factor [Chloroflexi bacterium]|nr:sigma-70 family RNA polymerase sigma factor [Chloroflexota bacterium]
MCMEWMKSRSASEGFSAPLCSIGFMDTKHDDPILNPLMTRIQRGDQTACTDLYDLYAPGVYRLAYSVLLHRQDAEDVVQEVFVYVFRNLKLYDPNRGQFRTWLYTITISRCRNARRRKMLPTVALSDLLLLGLEPHGPESENPETASLREDANRVLGQALKTLSSRLREAVALRYGQGLTYREMGEILNIPPKTAESRIRLAHEALRSAMQPNDIALLEEFLG